MKNKNKTTDEGTEADKKAIDAAAKARKEYLAKLKQADDDEFALLKFRAERNIEISNDIADNEEEAVQDRILSLTDEEIDILMYQKWFGNTSKQVVNLIQGSLKADLDSMQILNERYSDTLFEIDSKIEMMMNEFETLKNELVVE